MPDLNELETLLQSRREEILKTSMEVLKAGDGNLYTTDFLVLAASNRSLALINGFIQLGEQKNFLCMAPIVRMHLDTVLRLHAATMVENSEEMAQTALEGKPLNTLKDKKGNKLTDAHMRSSFLSFWSAQGHKFEWVNPVYQKTSGHIHLSAPHLFSMFEEVSPIEGTVQIALSGALDANYEELATEAFMAMIDITNLVTFYIGHWAKEKGLPE